MILEKKQLLHCLAMLFCLSCNGYAQTTNNSFVPAQGESKVTVVPEGLGAVTVYSGSGF